MIVLDGHKSHLSTKFEKYYQKNNIIILYLLIYSLYIIQLLDIGYFSILKRVYNWEFEIFIRGYIDYITKLEFFIVFKVAYFYIITLENIKTVFRGAGLVLYNPIIVLSKLDIKLRTPTPTESPFPKLDLWVS
jgi:hypothetical protein